MRKKKQNFPFSGFLPEFFQKTAGRIRVFLFSEKREEPFPLQQQIERARARCRAAEETFSGAVTTEMTDYAIYELEAAFRQYAALTRLKQQQEQENPERSRPKNALGDVHGGAAVVK